MRRVLCLTLILLFCMSLACPVFAAENDDFVNSPGSLPGGGDDSNNAVTPGTGSSSDGIWIPKTGDNIMMWVTVMLISVMALAATAVVFRKKFAN